MSTAQELYESAFQPGRPPRSVFYRAGMLDCLRYLTGESGNGAGRCPYPQGSVEFDAYFAGWDEGRLRHKTAIMEAEQHA